MFIESAKHSQNEKIFHPSSQSFEREWFTTMRLWNLKRAHIVDLYMISIVYFDWNIYCFPNEFWTRARSPWRKKFELTLMDGALYKTWEMKHVRHSLLGNASERIQRSFLECGVVAIDISWNFYYLIFLLLSNVSVYERMTQRVESSF